MSNVEDDIRIITDSLILDPFGIRLVSIPRIRNKQGTELRLNEMEWDDTGESLLYILEEEERDHSDMIAIEYLMPW